MKKNNLKDIDIDIDYTEECHSDGVLQVAKNVCFEYLENNIIKYSTEELETLLTLCELIYVKHIELKKNLKIKNFNNNYNIEIAKALDNITLGESIFEKSETTYYTSIAKDINSLCTQLKFCILTISKIIEEY